MLRVKVSSVSGYLKVISRIMRDWDETNLWFRGVSKSSYALLPSLYRKKYKITIEDEQEMYVDFIRKAKAFVPNYSRLCPIDWYILMQHYGFPTRLLDWTTGSLIALYFAVRDIDSDENCSVYILDPFTINESFHNYFRIPCIEDAFLQDERLINRYLPNVQLPELPISFDPPFIDKRIVAQKSCFTVHGTNESPFELYGNEKVKLAKIQINALQVDIKEELLSMGLSESTLFPDLEGLARELIFHHVIE